MLFKKELKEIPPCEFGKKLTKAELKYQFLAVAKVEQTKRSGEILIVDYYDTIKKELQVRFFADAVTQKHIIFSTNDGTWTSSSISRLLDKRVGLTRLSILEREGTQKTVSNYLNLFENHYWTSSPYGQNYIPSVKGATGTLEIWMQKKRDAERKKEYDRIADKDSRYHSLFKGKYPFAEQADRFFLMHFNSQPDLTYIFFNKLDGKGNRYGICSHCGKQIKLQRERPHKGDKTHCSRCGAEGKLIDLRYAEKINDNDTVAIANRQDGYITFETMTCYRSFTAAGKPIISYDDLYRTVYDIKKKTAYSSSGQRFYWGWTHYTKWAPGSHKIVMYPENLNEVTRDVIPYLDLAQICKENGKSINIIQLFLNCAQYPCTEYLSKMGFLKIAAREHLNRHVNVYGKTAAAVLAVRPEQVRWMAKANLDVDELSFIREVHYPLSREMFEYCRRYGLIPGYGRMNHLLNYMSFQKLINYLEAQKHHMRFSPYVISNLEYETLICFDDYVSMSEELKINLNRKNLFPQHIVFAHDKLKDRLNEIKVAKADEKSREALSLIGKRFKHYEKNGFCIVVPKIRSDFIREGQELSHCVGGQRYYENHIAGKALIFFIREADKPDVAKYTAEINMNTYTVVQCYGYGDSIPPKEVKDFITGFAKYLKSHPKKEINYAEDLRTEKSA